MNQQKKQVLVIGAGYAGMEATVRLAMKTRHQNVQITLINPSEVFIERPRLHQYAANQPVKRRPISEILNGTGVQFIRGEVKRMDADQQEVVVQSGMDSQRLHYDYLLYTAGSITDQDRVPGVRPYAYTLAPAGPRSAEALRSVLPDLNRQGGRVVVVGGGPTGIESAAEFAESYPGLHVFLFTQGVLGEQWGGKIQAHIRQVLAHLGVAVQERTTVKRVFQ